MRARLVDVFGEKLTGNDDICRAACGAARTTIRGECPSAKSQLATSTKPRLRFLSNSRHRPLNIQATHLDKQCISPAPSHQPCAHLHTLLTEYRPLLYSDPCYPPCKLDRPLPYTIASSSHVHKSLVSDKQISPSKSKTPNPRHRSLPQKPNARNNICRRFIRIMTAGISKGIGARLVAGIR